MGFGFIPEYLVRQTIAFCIVVDDKTLVVLGTLVHNLSERLKCREHAGIVLMNDLSILDVRFS